MADIWINLLVSFFATIEPVALICLLNLTLNEKSSSYSLQFMSKSHVFLNSLRPQIWEHTHLNSVMAALYYTGVELEKM